MRHVIVSDWMTLAGVVQAPVYSNEERTGAFLATYVAAPSENR